MAISGVFLEGAHAALVRRADLQSPSRRPAGAAARRCYGCLYLEAASVSSARRRAVAGGGRRTWGESPLQHLVDIHDCRRVCVRVRVKEGYLESRVVKGAAVAYRVKRVAAREERLEEVAVGAV
jgi:hypothetical protein